MDHHAVDRRGRELANFPGQHINVGCGPSQFVRRIEHTRALDRRRAPGFVSLGDLDQRLDALPMLRAPADPLPSDCFPQEIGFENLSRRPRVGFAIVTNVVRRPYVFAFDVLLTLRAAREREAIISLARAAVWCASVARYAASSGSICSPSVISAGTSAGGTIAAGADRATITPTFAALPIASAAATRPRKARRGSWGRSNDGGESGAPGAGNVCCRFMVRVAFEIGLSRPRQGTALAAGS